MDMEPVMTLEEYKQSIIRSLNFGIYHTDLQDAYSVGFRNGIRYSKCMIDGIEPIYEDVTYTPQTERSK